MTALVPYETGTVSVAADGTAVTGVGTIWSGTNVRPGDRFDSGHFSALIVEVVDETHLTITPWPGSTLSGAPYKIWPNYPQRVVGAEAMATVNQLVAALDVDGFIWFVAADLTEPDPSLGNDGQYADQPTTGKKWVKVGGVWTYLGIFKAFQFTGAYNVVTTYSVGDVMTDAGSSYVWINPTPGSGHAAPNPTYWQLLAAKGETGAAGPTGAGYGGTSTTSRTIGTGSQAFTTQAGLAYQDGARVRASSAANTSNWMAGLATYAGTTLTINADETNGSGTHDDWIFNVVGESGAGDLSSANNLSDLANKSMARDNLGVPQSYGQCRLTLSGGNLVLSPLNGNLLTVNGTPSVVPDAGVSLAATGLSPGTTYFIYATASGGTINALEASTTAHATSTTAGNKGTEIKTGDNTRTLVGIARAVTGPAWVDSGSQRFVLSWFNRSGKSGVANTTATRSITNASWTEFHSELRVEFLTWADELVEVNPSASGYVGVASQVTFFAIGFDGTTPEPGMSTISDGSGSGGSLRPLSLSARRRLSEGYHYATLLGGNNASAQASIYFGSAADGSRSANIVSVMG
ncbi:hypothetical protein [Bradyrhizobium japonicum]|uniref:hypothetical protein n=1 Tax=Bradyrhizobium japonicum TaxID=375 RepID=UPI001BAA2F8F|nr:hypothetical protein [Bradyrhizobium japonicum]MBR0962261.1 hypothetical protein [Bradyrhizobium japonicum]